MHEAAEEVGEPAWPMPLPEHLRKGWDSATADIANMGERMGGGLVAGLFLREFVGEGITWAHLDIAGRRSTRAGRSGTRRRAGRDRRYGRWSGSRSLRPRVILAESA
ncbi:hypothetical protein GCM10023238_25780 [Streptomyces heliomycini]